MITIFAGKGGVGKTTCAATSALHHSRLGEKTLAISTDATPSLSHIFGVTDNAKPARVKENLYISELGLREVKEMWDRKFGREVYEVFSSFVSIEYEDFLEFMTSLLPGMFDEFMVDYIRELDLASEYETIIWDTAPLGQTLTLLQTPTLVMRHLRMAPRIYSKLKRGQKIKESLMDIIERWHELSETNIDFLRYQVGFIMVTIPEALAIEQLDGVFSELNKFGFKVGELIVNNVVRNADSDFLLTRAKEQTGYLKYIREKFAYLKITELPMFPYELKGLERLKEAEKSLFGSAAEVVAKD